MKVLFHQDNALGHKSVKKIAKMQELDFEFLLMMLMKKYWKKYQIEKDKKNLHSVESVQSTDAPFVKNV